MSERTYTRADLERARRAWDEGEFGPAWAPYRKQAAASGFIFPPDGTRWDSWEDEEPSQRAIVYRAIEDTPRLLSDAIRRSRSWAQVVAVLMRELARWREDATLAERDAAWEREQRPTRREAAERLHDVLERLR